MEDALSLDQLNKVIQGKESQQKGKSFEDQVEKTFKEKGILHLRIPQSSKIIRIRKKDKNGNIRVESKNVFLPSALDFLVFHEGRNFFLDCKATSKDFLYKSHFINQGQKKDSSTHRQYQILKQAYKRQYCQSAGFLISFNGDERYFPIKILVNIFEIRGSIKPGDGYKMDDFLKAFFPDGKYGAHPSLDDLHDWGSV